MSTLVEAMAKALRDVVRKKFNREWNADDPTLREFCIAALKAIPPEYRNDLLQKVIDEAQP